MSLNRLGYVASTWEETIRNIQDGEYLKNMRMTKPIEENKRKRREAEMRRFQRPLKSEELAVLEELFRSMRASWTAE